MSSNDKVRATFHPDNKPTDPHAELRERMAVALAEALQKANRNGTNVFNLHVAADALVAAGFGDVAAERARAAEMLRRIADAREEYVRSGDNQLDPVRLQVATIRSVAEVIDGNLSPLFGLLPSWRWDEFGIDPDTFDFEQSSPKRPPIVRDTDGAPVGVDGRQLAAELGVAPLTMSELADIRDQNQADDRDDV